MSWVSADELRHLLSEGMEVGFGCRNFQCQAFPCSTRHTFSIQFQAHSAMQTSRNIHKYIQYVLYHKMLGELAFSLSCFFFKLELKFLLMQGEGLRWNILRAEWHSTQKKDKRIWNCEVFWSSGRKANEKTTSMADHFFVLRVSRIYFYIWLIFLSFF